MRRRKRRRKDHDELTFPESNEEEEEKERRFVGRMEVFGGGPEEEIPLTLCNYDRKRRRRVDKGDDQSKKVISVVIRKNGYR